MRLNVSHFEDLNFTVLTEALVNNNVNSVGIHAGSVILFMVYDLINDYNTMSVVSSNILHIL